ncbi:alpha/beta hydrolase [Streptomyces rapamycinicus]|uniref:Alpha/beta hydrolase n=2 Tax=Streptomyces rapamycinicus TaxID=1226757 RepID=A0A0A0N9K3_STRRN|nr:alpha/beta fold hydrolase [Streptomyces rapamycinicus]AGP53876.1 alpha/beta hydrolase [Streptomyces rapamycinicus NRRL 5491]MBB4781366.1 pimeloyl-ACP methyl ester carboxylesterase [Streptomyces rapamycinicus]RLV73989.1 alpha/beta hydrolase [Streptomyces rapamycinicus NRRL 5491]UTO61990.1 alpha/beta hydrolase [Streptomyces rapamycinicus]UTP29942.1 alpha/beta hydrolase [Streptomyces rapamycinicus NRRL 5491]
MSATSPRTPLTDSDPGPVPSGTVFVLVHGAWHASWQWASTQRALARLGAASLAVDLPGHGFEAQLPSGLLLPGQPGLATEKSALAGVTLEECAEAVVAALRSVRRYPKVALVSHSAGGAPASLAAERAPDLVDELIHLSSFVPAGRPRFADYLTSPEQTATARGQGLMLGDPEAIGAFRINPRSADPAYVEELRLAFYDDVPAGSFARWYQALSPDLPFAVPTTPITLTRERWGRIPRTFIRCAEDWACTPAMQDLMIAEADAAMPDRPFTVRPLPGSHSPFAARPEELAATLIGGR